MSVLACSRAVAPGVSVDSSLRGLIPSDATVIAGVQVRNITESALYRKHQQELAIPMLDSYSERIGMDPRKDLTEAVVAWAGNQPLALLHGRVNVGKIRPNLVSMGGKESTYGGRTIIGTPEYSVLFLSNATAAIGALPTLKATADRSGGTVDRGPELARMMARLPKSDQIWIVSRSGLPFVNLPMRSDIKSALSNVIDSVSSSDAGLELDGGLHLRADFDCVSDAGAQRVNDAIRAGVALGRLTTKDDEADLLRAYDAIQIDKKGQEVKLTADWSSEMVEKILPRLLSLNKAR